MAWSAVLRNQNCQENLTAHHRQSHSLAAIFMMVDRNYDEIISELLRQVDRHAEELTRQSEKSDLLWTEQRAINAELFLNLNQLGDKVATIGDKVIVIGDKVTEIVDKVVAISDKVVDIGNKVVAIGNKAADIGDKVVAIGDQVIIMGDKVAAIGDQVIVMGDKLEEQTAVMNQNQSMAFQTAAILDRIIKVNKLKL